MTAYIFKRLLLIVPTLFAIMVLNFVIVQAAPGGPIDQIVAQLQGQNTDSTARISGNTGAETGQANQNSRQIGGGHLADVAEVRKAAGDRNGAH